MSLRPLIATSACMATIVGCSEFANLDYVGTYIGDGTTTTAVGGSLSQRSFSSISLVQNDEPLGLVWRDSDCEVLFTESSGYSLTPITCQLENGWSIEYRTGRLVFGCDYDPVLEKCDNTVDFRANFKLKSASGDPFEGTLAFTGKE